MINSVWTVPLLKLRSSWGIWRSLLLLIALSALVAKIASTFDVAGLAGQRSYLQFPNIWVNAVWLVHYFTYLFAFVLIAIIRRDVDQSLVRQAFIFGWTRSQLIASYGFNALLMALMSVFVAMGLSAYFGKMAEAAIIDVAVLKVLVVFFLSSLTLFAIATFMALIATSSISAVIGLLMLNFLGEGIAGRLFSYVGWEKAASYLPFASLTKCLPSPVFPPFSSAGMAIDWIFVAVAGGYAILFLGLSWARLKYADW